jgi:hypothetical protein
VTGDGVHQLSCTATDLAGNTSAPVTLTVMIDTTPPVTSFAAAPGPLNGRPLVTVSATVTVSPGNISATTACFDSSGLYADLSATDNVSGVAAINYGSAQIVPGQPLPIPALSNSSAGAAATVPFFSDGGYVLSYASVDNAGNQEAPHMSWIFVARAIGIACATGPLPVSSLPPTGTITVKGSLKIGPFTIPFSFSFTYSRRRA